MARIEYHIVVVDRWSGSKPMPSVRKMVDAGLPPVVAVRWVKVRREMSPVTLKRKAQECRN